jgi:hypothetical protein
MGETRTHHIAFAWLFWLHNEWAGRQFVHSLVNRVSRLISITFAEASFCEKRFLLILIKTAQ